MNQYQKQQIYAQTEHVLLLTTALEQKIAFSKQKQKENEEYIAKLSDCNDSLTNVYTVYKADLDVNSVHKICSENIGSECRILLQQIYKEICEHFINDNVVCEIEEIYNKIGEMSTEISQEYLLEIEIMEKLVDEKNKKIEDEKQETKILEKQLAIEIFELEKDLSKENEESHIEHQICNEQILKKDLENIVDSLEKEVAGITLTIEGFRVEVDILEEPINIMLKENKHLKCDCLELVNDCKNRINGIDNDIKSINSFINEYKTNLEVFNQKELDLIREQENFKVHHSQINNLMINVSSSIVRLEQLLTTEITSKENISQEKKELIQKENELFIATNCEFKNLKIKIVDTEECMVKFTEEIKIFIESIANINEEMLKVKQNYDAFILNLENVAQEKDIQIVLMGLEQRRQELNKLVASTLENDLKCNNSYVREIDLKQNEILELENEKKEIQGHINEELLNVNKLKLNKVHTAKEIEKIKEEKRKINNLSKEIDKIRNIKAKVVELKDLKIAKQPTVDMINFTKPKTPVKQVNKNIHARHWDSDSSVEGEIHFSEMLKVHTARK